MFKALEQMAICLAEQTNVDHRNPNPFPIWLQKSWNALHLTLPINVGSLKDSSIIWVSIVA